MNQTQLWLAFSLFATSTLVPLPAGAAIDLDEEGDTEEGAELETDAEASETESSANQAIEAEAAPPADKAWDPEAFQFELGVRGRMLVVPKFLINAFGVQGGRDVVVGGVGVEGGMAKGSFEVLTSVWYAGYSLQNTPFKGPGDGNEAWEIIRSNLGMVYVTADLLWRNQITHGWHWYLGTGLGVGFVTGTLQRNEAYWTNGASPFVPGNPSTDLAPCLAPGAPSPLECPGPPSNDNKYDLSNNTTSAAWPIYPWINFQVGLRYQPIQQFIARLDLGVGSSGFWLGIGADYGL